MDERDGFRRMIFAKMYAKTLDWARHRHAPYYLTGASFAEASFFPIPPDIMLMTMALAKPERAWHYAGLATIGSVLGGALGYFIGAYFLHLIFPYITEFGYEPAFALVQHWFTVWGFVVVFVAGFSPVPYKLFTIGAGAMSVKFLPFLFASLISRGLRFYLVSAVMYWGGPRIEKVLHKYVDWIGWVLVVILVVIIGLWQLGIF